MSRSFRVGGPLVMTMLPDIPICELLASIRWHFVTAGAAVVMVTRLFLSV